MVSREEELSIVRQVSCRCFQSPFPKRFTLDVIGSERFRKTRNNSPNLNYRLRSSLELAFKAAMLDIQLRPIKDRIFDSVTPLVPSACSPLAITVSAFACGVLSCICAVFDNVLLSTAFWALNRALDCLDGAVARKRNQSSDLGGFFDLLGDFIVYSAIPISCAVTRNEEPNAKSVWLSVAVLEASFHVNNFVLFYIGAVLEKRKGSGNGDKKSKIKELTSVAMRPALIEGSESAAFFTAMLMYPRYLQLLSWTMAFLVCFGIAQRTMWLLKALG